MKPNLKFFIIIFLVATLVSCSKTKETPEPSSDNSFTSFTFNVAENNALPQAIVCDIVSDTIYATTFAGTDITALRPNFTTNGISVTVAGEIQISNQTIQNFSSLVTYVVTAEDGSTKNYIVKFSYPCT